MRSFQYLFITFVLVSVAILANKFHSPNITKAALVSIYYVKVTKDDDFNEKN